MRLFHWLEVDLIDFIPGTIVTFPKFDFTMNGKLTELPFTLEPGHLEGTELRNPRGEAVGRLINVRKTSAGGFVGEMVRLDEPGAPLINRGWGISRGLTNLRQLWYAQVLHRYNEALAMDHIISFRLISFDGSCEPPNCVTVSDNNGPARVLKEYPPFPSTEQVAAQTPDPFIYFNKEPGRGCSQQHES